MATKIKKPSEAGKIPVAPGIKLESLIQFNGDCIDPLALVVITEALDYALETSARRLKSLGKIFSGVEESAYGKGAGVLPTIKAIREAMLLAPQCGRPIKMPPPSPEAAIVAKAEERVAELAKPPVKEPPKAKKVTPAIKKVNEAIGKIWESVGVKERAAIATSGGLSGKVGSKAWAGLTEAEKGSISGWMETQVAERKAKPKKEVGERTLPGLWGKVSFEGTGKEAGLTGEYDSFGALAKALGVRTRGAKTQVIAFERAGLSVSGNGEPVKGGRLTVTRVKPTPPKYQAPIIVEEKVPKKVEGPPLPWAKVTKEGKLVRWEDAEGKPIPEELWP